MFPQKNRLTTKDVRYIQKQRNVLWTKHFGVLRIKQYSNKRHHQISIYIAAKIIPKASWRHQLKRKILAKLESRITFDRPSNSGEYYKIFIFLNKKTLHKESMLGSVQERKQYIDFILTMFVQERKFIEKKMGI